MEGQCPCRVKSLTSVVFSCVVLFNAFGDVAAQSYKQHRCSNRLENALEHMRRRSGQVKSSRSLAEQTPYTLYYSLYGQNVDQADQFDDDEDFYNTGGGYRGYYAKMHRGTQRPSYSSSSSGVDDEFSADHNQRQPHKLLAVSRVDVEDLRVKLPSSSAARWVEVDKCNFSTENSTLDTRLIFPDLTISGKVVLQPTGGKCNMILRLRHAGIEFRTIPIGFETRGVTMGNENSSRRTGAATVRTDSHFAEPGFISVFAHGCQGPTGIRLRQNSKRRFGFASGDQTAPLPPVPHIELSEPQVILGTASSSKTANRWGKFHNLHLQQQQLRPSDYDIRSEAATYTAQQQAATNHQRQQNFNWDNNPYTEHNYDSREFYDETLGPSIDNFYRGHFRKKRQVSLRRKQRQQRKSDDSIDDQMNFSDDVLHVGDDLQDLVQPDARAFAEIFAGNGGGGSGGAFGTASERDEVNDAFTKELERLFSMGVRGLLTTYMQRALQPAIKETLMENMGYTLSYG